MGQYFIAVNETKKEYFTPWDIGVGAKLWEWCANHQAGVFPYLLRLSSETGGGDIQGQSYFAGRWAKDRVSLVGDYNESNLYERAKAKFTNIADGLIKEYNHFIKIEELKLKKRR